MKIFKSYFETFQINSIPPKEKNFCCCNKTRNETKKKKEKQQKIVEQLFIISFILNSFFQCCSPSFTTPKDICKNVNKEKTKKNMYLPIKIMWTCSIKVAVVRAGSTRNLAKKKYWKYWNDKTKESRHNPWLRNVYSKKSPTVIIITSTENNDNRQNYNNTTKLAIAAVLLTTLATATTKVDEMPTTNKQTHQQALRLHINLNKYKAPFMKSDWILLRA